MATNEPQPVGMLLNTDRCTGCYSCQSACRDINRVPFEEKWLEVVRRKPTVIDGDLRLYHLLAPALDKCAECVERENPPLCVRGVHGKLPVCCTGRKADTLAEKQRPVGAVRAIS